MALKHNSDAFDDEDDRELSASHQADDSEDDEVELPDDDDFIIETVDDTPEVEEEPTDEDLSGYGRKVQKRITKLARDKTEEIKNRQAAEQRERAALDYARTVMAEKERLQKALDAQRASTTEQTKGRVESQLESAQSAYRSAYEEGDADGMAAAQVKIARLQAEAYQMERDQAQLQALREQQAAQAQQQAAQAQQQAAQAQQQSQYQQPQPQQYSARLQKWLSENESWWQKDRVLTGAAMGLHEQLVEEGVAPDSKEYYDTLTSELHSQFPDRFSTTDKSKTRAPVVAPATRSGKKPRRTVRLTASEMSIATSLGLTPKQYAEQKLKMEQMND